MDIIEFILARYNYWIFITLMMLGLYIVISRGNLVKTMIGLNLFQTSVFIFYISIGKVVGGTAPILIGSYSDEGDHGEGHGEGYGDTHGESEGGEGGYETDAAYEGVTAESADPESLHDTDGLEGASNSLDAQVPGGDAVAAGSDSLHQVPDTAGAAADTGAAAAGYAADGAAEILYTNPLPHVLILTAIVVGVATTAVGLALAVRIREAYGTIEEDELEAEDHFAEFGVPLQRRGQAENGGGTA